MCTLPEFATLSTVEVMPSQKIARVTSNSSPRKSSTNRSRKRKFIEREPEELLFIDPPGESLTQKERDLRIAEANVLFPKYMATHNAKRVKVNTDTKRQPGAPAKPLLYLPTSEYSNWHPYYQCSAIVDIKTRTKVLRFFELDCRNPGSPIARNCPNEKEMDPLYYDLEWNQRIAPLQPVFIVPPEKGSFDHYLLRSKGVVNPDDRIVMDSFVLALQREMGGEYFDINGIRYYPRSNGRVATFYDEKSRRLKCMKYGHLDVDIFLRNREIERCLEKIRMVYLMKRIPWTDEVEEEWDRKIVKFVNPFTVCKGRTFYSMQQDLGIEDERYCPPKQLNDAGDEPPLGADAEELGKSFYWSARAERMVSVEELRREREQTEESDLIYQINVALEEGKRAGSKSRSLFHSVCSE